MPQPTPQDNFRNQAKVVPLVIGFLTIVLGFFSLTMMNTLGSAKFIFLVSGIIFITVLTFGLHHLLWEGACHPLEPIPRRVAILVSLLVCPFTGFLGYAWLDVVTIFVGSIPGIEVVHSYDIWFGVLGAALGMVTFLVAGVRMPRYPFLRFLMAFHLLGLGMVALMQLAPSFIDFSWSAEIVARELGNVGKLAGFVWVWFVVWGASILLYLWQYRRYKRYVRTAEVTPADG